MRYEPNTLRDDEGNVIPPVIITKPSVVPVIISNEKLTETYGNQTTDPHTINKTIEKVDLINDTFYVTVYYPHWATTMVPDGNGGYKQHIAREVFSIGRKELEDIETCEYLIKFGVQREIVYGVKNGTYNIDPNLPENKTNNKDTDVKTESKSNVIPWLVGGLAILKFLI